jgi:MinD-like ATPase involved in chromosome partitioning or flagellar assembly
MDWEEPLTRVSLGLPPDDAGLSWLDDGRAVARRWPGSRTVAVAQTTTGVNQAPVASALAAVFGRWGHPGVVVWDNNESGGVLRWRSAWAGHGATIANLLANVPALLQPLPSPGGIEPFVHPQTEDRYDVLQAGDPAQSVWRLSAPAVEVLHTCLARYYDLVLVDVGHDVGAVTWRAAVAQADQLVVAVSELSEVTTAVRLLDTLRWDDPKSRALARRAMVVVVQPSPDVSVDGIVRRLSGVASDVVVIPFDQGFQSGILHYTALGEPAQRAWLRAGAVLAERLNWTDPLN